MEFWITVVGLLRRARVVIPAVLVAATFGATAFAMTPVRYVSSATMVLTTTEFGGTESQDPANPTDLTNPMLNFSESLRTTSAILIEGMNTRGVAAELDAQGPTELVVNDGRTNPDLLSLNGPFLYIVGKSTSSDDAARVVVAAQTLMREKLREWQRTLRAPERTYVSLVDVVAPNVPEPDRGRATKLGLLAFVFGFALSLGVAYLSQVRAWRRARTAGRGRLVEGQPVTDPHVPELDGVVLPAPPPVPAAAGSQTVRLVEPVLAKSSGGAPTTPTNGTATPKAPANGARVTGSRANGSPANGSPANGSPANGSPANGSAANGSATPRASSTRSPLQQARVKGRTSRPGISKKARSRNS